MNKNKNAQTIVVNQDSSDSTRLVVEVRPSDGSPKSRRPVRGQDEVLRFAREHGVNEKTIDWNGFQDRLPAHKPQAAASQR